MTHWICLLIAEDSIYPLLNRIKICLRDAIHSICVALCCQSGDTYKKTFQKERGSTCEWNQLNSEVNLVECFQMPFKKSHKWMTFLKTLLWLHAVLQLYVILACAAGLLAQCLMSYSSHTVWFMAKKSSAPQHCTLHFWTTTKNAWLRVALPGMIQERAERVCDLYLQQVLYILGKHNKRKSRAKSPPLIYVRLMFPNSWMWDIHMVSPV